MDGQVLAIREALDDGGLRRHVAILAYAAKYASALYGPFRDAVDVTIAGGGDRKGYQQDCRNAREAWRRSASTSARAPTSIMVKPALAYLDIIARARAELDLPLAAYHVSGEYAMIKAAAERGWIDGPAVALEQLTAIKRAGADLILTYFARDLAEVLGVTDDPTNEELFDAGPAGDPRRGQLAGAGVPLGRAARPTSWPGPRGPTCGTSRAAASSTASSPTAPSSSATPIPAVVDAVRARGAATARRSARPPPARCCWPRPSPTGCRRWSRCGWCRAAPRPP